MSDLDWWDWFSFVIVFIVIGFWIGCLFWHWLLKRNSEHGPNSRDWKDKITCEGDEYYLWEIDICPCPCL